ncbi:ferric reductase-like transmembrane domain-containing protein [Phenylobacterium sp.]|uniref:ferredoxin reductase family protein n=1 Tax=Phenylobacterium sp. TaxID=1871053 RepID=UPI003921AE14
MGLARIKVAFGLLAGALTAAWLASVAGGTSTTPWPTTFWQARSLLIPFSGVLAIGFMASGVLLAARPVQVERLLGGLDKFYRLHKWLGIGALVLAVAHWLLEVGPRWMTGWGWITRPARAPRPPGPQPEGFEALMRGLRHPAGEAGEWAFYLMVVLVLLALWKRFPYHLFFKTHRLMAPVFLALVFHSVVMTPQAWWTAPVGVLSGLLMAAATVAAGASLFGRIGQSRKAAGRVASLRAYDDNAVLDVGVELATAWPGHQAGQFAFLDFDDPEGAHPFTASSAWKDDGRLVFSIKGLGDYTRRLPELLRVGQGVTVEGPYGCFDFQGEAPRQLWIGGGVGVTPFIARLEALKGRTETRPVDFVYSTAAPDEAFIAHVRELAEAAGVRFRLYDSNREGFLTPEALKAWAPGWREADVWFCGPAKFGEALRKAMTADGLPAARFHQELFEMR